MFQSPSAVTRAENGSSNHGSIKACHMNEPVLGYEPGILRVLQSKEETRSFYDKIAKVYDLLAEFSEQSVRDAGLEMLATASGETILEIGCGTGHSLVTMANDVGQQGKVVGVDISENMLEETRKLLIHEKVELHRCDAAQLPFRRARLAAVGDVSEDVSYMIEMDFAFPGRPSFMDVWVDVHNVPVLGNVRIGQYRVPFGMDALTSVRELTFLERASPFAFNPFRQISIGFHDNNDAQTLTWSAAAFGFPTDVWGDNTGDKGYGMASRVTALPYYAEDGSSLLHLGVDYSLTRPSTQTLEYRNQPEFGGPFIGATGNTPSVPFFVDTGVMSATSSNLFNAEIAAVRNQAYIQSELTYALVSLTNGGTATFPGYYAQAGYFVTGETRSYNKLAGVLGRVKPLHNWGEPCGYGAVELAARYSYLDLTSRSISGGRMNDVTLGVNWYLNQYTKFQLNYIRSIVDQTSTSTNNIDTNIVAIRAQLDF